MPSAARAPASATCCGCSSSRPRSASRSEEHTSELQSQSNLVCRLLLEKKNGQDRGPPERWSDAHVHPDVCRCEKRESSTCLPQELARLHRSMAMSHDAPRFQDNDLPQ